MSPIIDDRTMNKLLKNPRLDEDEGLGIFNLLKPIDGKKRRKKNITPEEVVKVYLTKREFKNISAGQYSDFVATDMEDETLGDITPCDVLVFFIEVDSEEEADEFEFTNEQITKIRKAIALYLVDNPDCVDCRADLVFLVHLEDDQLMIQHQIGIARLLFLSKKLEED